MDVFIVMFNSYKGGREWDDSDRVEAVYADKADADAACVTLNRELTTLGKSYEKDLAALGEGAARPTFDEWLDRFLEEPHYDVAYYSVDRHTVRRGGTMEVYAIKHHVDPDNRDWDDFDHLVEKIYLDRGLAEKVALRENLDLYGDYQWGHDYDEDEILPFDEWLEFAVENEEAYYEVVTLPVVTEVEE